MAPLDLTWRRSASHGATKSKRDVPGEIPGRAR
jgi:hypothetical protein